MKIEEIDLLDLDRFLAQEHHEMFSYLRKEDPVSWHAEPDGPGFWNIVRHADRVMSSCVRNYSCTRFLRGESKKHDR